MSQYGRRMSAKLTRHINREIAEGRLDPNDKAAVEREMSRFAQGREGRREAGRMMSDMLGDAMRKAGFKRRGGKWEI